MSEPGDADEYGVTDGYHDISGVWHPTSPATRAALHAAIGHPQPGPPLWFVPVGSTERLHSACHLTLEDGGDRGVVEQLPSDIPIGYHRLRPVNGGAVTRLFVHPDRCPTPPAGWGVAAQLYSTMSAASQGIGDLGDLARLARWVERHGGSSILLSPLHAPDPGRRQQDSPYSPATRRWRSPLHLRVPGVASHRTALIERQRVWERKREALWAMFERDGALPSAPWRRWAIEQGESLEQWARWCAASEQRPTPHVGEFHAWLQWCIDRQLAAAHEAAPSVSLIGDLAIGFDPHGADAAHFAEVLAPGCRIGSPPDAFNPAGQDWGLPPFSPWKLRAHGYEPFITTVRGALRGLQGLRIDHVMGFFRQYWVVGELGGASGAYVRFPADELLSILAIEATRAGAFVIGEDLGTVEPHVRSTMRRFGVLGTVVMWFEDADPEDYPSEVLATVSTHDLPTVAGVWGSLDGDELTGDRLKRILGATPISGVADVVVEVHRRLAAAPSRLKLVTLDDMTLAEQRPNVPGTTTERPNWCLPLPLALEDLERSPLAERVAGIMNSPADLPRS